MTYYSHTHTHTHTHINTHSPTHAYPHPHTHTYTYPQHQCTRSTCCDLSKRNSKLKNTGTLTCMYVCACMYVVGGDWKWGFFFSLFMGSACCWRGRLCFGRGKDSGFVSYIYVFWRMLGWWVGVCLYTRVRTQTTWVLDVSPGVGRTPEESEELRSTKAQYTCRPYRCTKYICLYICWAAGFDDVG